jgi:hypothetical protein
MQNKCALEHLVSTICIRFYQETMCYIVYEMCLWMDWHCLPWWAVRKAHCVYLRFGRVRNCMSHIYQSVSQLFDTINRITWYYRVIKTSLCTWWLQYRKLQVMFKVSTTSLQTFIDTPNCVLEDRVEYSTVHIPNVFCDGHLRIISCVGIVRIHWVQCTETFWSLCTKHCKYVLAKI